MTPLVITLAVAALALFWFIGRRTTQRRGGDVSETPQEATKAARHEIDLPIQTSKGLPDSEALRGVDEPCPQAENVVLGNPLKVEVEKPESVDLEKESSTSVSADANLKVSDEDHDPKIISVDGDSLADPLPPASAVPVLSVGSDETHPHDFEELLVPLVVTVHDSGLGFVSTNSDEQATSVLSRSDDDPLPRVSAEADRVLSAEASKESSDEYIEKMPARYRPPTQKAPRQKIVRTENLTVHPAAQVEERLGIRVRLTFDRFGFCRLGLLPERTSEMDNEVTVKYGGGALHLTAQEDWYQDLHFERVGDYMRRGLELKGVLTNEQSARWLLSGRDLYVLASNQRASGFVSTSRIVIGRSHVVLCTAELVSQVESILSEAGCEVYSRLDESHGVPADWTGFRGVVPTKAISLTLDGDPFYSIKPAPDIEIELEGGVCLRNSAWLVGYPPRIKILGQSNTAMKVLIDNNLAQQSTDGSFTANGHDLPGQHTVSCEGLSCSRSYSIEEPTDSWQLWAAHQFNDADICGPLVQVKVENAASRIFSVAMSNPVLLGAEPGQIFWCSPRRVARWKGFVPFDVVWAIPAHPLRCDKKTARILRFAESPVTDTKTLTRPGLAWSHAILDASRKGLRVEDVGAASTEQWNDYKKVARGIWRRAR
jgi:hypothetical protein